MYTIESFINSLKTKSEIKEELNKTLNPKLWDKNNELLPEVKEKIFDIVNQFKDNLTDAGAELNINDIVLLGSNANYNYNDQSDLDIHIIADDTIDCSKQHLPVIYNAYKKLFNDKYDININGIETEVYVEEGTKSNANSAGIYSLKNGWLNKPSKDIETPNINSIQFYKLLDSWKRRYLKLITDATSNTLEDIENYLDEIQQLRIESVAKEGEFGLGNLVFKKIRNLGYLNELKELRNKIISDNLSL